MICSFLLDGRKAEIVEDWQLFLTHSLVPSPISYGLQQREGSWGFWSSPPRLSLQFRAELQGFFLRVSLLLPCISESQAIPTNNHLITFPRLHKYYFGLLASLYCVHNQAPAHAERAWRRSRNSSASFALKCGEAKRNHRDPCSVLASPNPPHRWKAIFSFPVWLPECFRERQSHSC